MKSQPAITVNTTDLATLARNAPTTELVAIFDYAETLKTVLSGLINQPRCDGLADAWVMGMLEQLYQTHDAVGAALLTRTDDAQICAPVLANWLEPAMHTEDAEALLALLRGVAKRAKIMPDIRLGAPAAA